MKEDRQSRVCHRMDAQPSGGSGSHLSPDDNPIELRLRNATQQDEAKNLPFSSRATRDCYRVAADRVRVESAQPRAAIDARRAFADRLGHGNG